MENITNVMAVEYKDGKVYFLDQTLLPNEVILEEMKTVEACWEAIKKLKVRGAPAIGIGAAFSLVVASRNIIAESFEDFYLSFKKAKEYLSTSRPTAVNLFWALDRIDKKVLESKHQSVNVIKEIILKEALTIQKEDIEVCRKIGEYGQEIIKNGMGILTHCNAGALATSKYGTALAPIYIAQERGIDVKVFADETRPLLQGSRLTAFELFMNHVDVTLITDNMAAVVMQKGWIQACIVGCDRVAANGDAANKIGTYGVALLAKAHNIAFYIACPTSTIDLTIQTGTEIPIEEREQEEITCGMGKQTAPKGIKTFNPAFDVTPNHLITGIITEKGILKPPYTQAILNLFK